MGSGSNKHLILSGMGSSGGGTFDLVKIDGMATIQGDIAFADYLLNGKCNTDGSMFGQTVEINGDCDVAGSMQAKRVKVYGRARLGGDLIGDDVELTGELVVKGNCEAETFAGKGSLTVDGMLNAGNIDLWLYGNSKINEIGGETIRIRKHERDLIQLLKMMFFPFASDLTARIVEGDDIYLENTKVQVVRGNNVTLGPGCEIKRVEYKYALRKEKGVKVEQEVKR